MEEIWKDIQGYEGLYQVSNLGRVKSLKCGKKKILKPYRDSKGYLQVDLRKNNKRAHGRVHRLVAQAFIVNQNNLPQINHIDENKENNCVDNLEWCTNKYNHDYGYHNERVAKSNYKKVIGINMINGYILELNSMKQGKEYDFNPRCISGCCCGERKTHKGYKWYYAK